MGGLLTLKKLEAPPSIQLGGLWNAASSPTLEWGPTRSRQRFCTFRDTGTMLLEKNFTVDVILQKIPHRRRTWTFQSYSPSGVNVHPMLYWTQSPHNSTQTASRPVHPVQSTLSSDMCGHVLSPKIAPPFTTI